MEVKRCGGADDPERDWRDGPYSVDLLQLFWRCVQDASEVAKASDQRLRRLLDVGARDGEREQKFDDLVVIEAFESRSDEALAESLTMAVMVRVAHGETARSERAALNGFGKGWYRPQRLAGQTAPPEAVLIFKPRSTSDHRCVPACP